MMSNRVEFVLTVYALSKLGAAAVLVSPAWKATEVGRALDLTGPTLAVADGPGVAVMTERLGTDAVVDVDEDGVLATATNGDHSRLDERGIGPADESVLVFSSGTTGMPKGVMWRHEDAFFAA